VLREVASDSNPPGRGKISNEFDTIFPECGVIGYQLCDAVDAINKKIA
jgi:hypothetical protein